MQSKPTIQAVIFDMGGVILRTEDRMPRAALAALNGMQYEALDEAVFGSETARRATLGEISEEEHWQAVARRFGLSPEALATFREQFWAGDRVDARLVEMIEALRPARKTALLSNAWPGARQTLVNSYGIGNIFDVWVFSSEVGLAKPDERIYRLTLDELKTEPQDALFVDDFAANIEAAQKVGMQTIHFRTFEQFHVDFQTLIE